MAPEILELCVSEEINHKRYNNLVDLWSIGVVFYYMLFGSYPFPGIANNSARNEKNGATSQSDKKETFKKIKVQIDRESGDKLKFPDDQGKVSEASKDFLRKLLEKNPNKRLTWEEFFNHEFLYPLAKCTELVSGKTFDIKPADVSAKLKPRFENFHFKDSKFIIAHLKSEPTYGLNHSIDARANQVMSECVPLKGTLFSLHKETPD